MTSPFVGRNATRTALLTLGGAAGTVGALYAYVLASLIFGPRPAGAVIALSLLPDCASLAATATRSIAWVAALFGSAIFLALAFFARRLVALSCLLFAALSSSALVLLSYPVVLALDHLFDRTFHNHISFFAAIAVFGLISSAIVHRYVRLNHPSVA